MHVAVGVGSQRIAQLLDTRQHASQWNHLRWQAQATKHAVGHMPTDVVPMVMGTHTPDTFEVFLLQKGHDTVHIPARIDHKHLLGAAIANHVGIIAHLLGNLEKEEKNEHLFPMSSVSCRKSHLGREKRRGK